MTDKIKAIRVDVKKGVASLRGRWPEYTSATPDFFKHCREIAEIDGRTAHFTMANARASYEVIDREGNQSEGMDDKRRCYYLHLVVDHKDKYVDKRTLTKVL